METPATYHLSGNSSPQVQETSAIGEHDAKRRKVRKGTRSCWECKRRKVRCGFNSPEDAICVGCLRRGTECIGQEFSDEMLPPADRAHQAADRGHQSVDSTWEFGDRMVRVEAMIRELVKSVGGGSRVTSPSTPAASTDSRDPSRGYGIPTPNSFSSESAQHSALCEPLASHRIHQTDSIPIIPTHGSSLRHEPNGLRILDRNKHEKLSRTLYDALPSRADVELICEAGSRISVYLTQHMRMPYAEIERVGIEDAKQKLLNGPGPEAHPVLLAKHMFALATFLQYLHPACHENIKDLSEAPRDMMQRLVDTAISYVTTNDELLGSVEGLECVTMEGTFLANIGNLRRAWLAFQRAISLAQLMGIHRAVSHQPLNFLDNGNTKVDTKVLWFRIIYVDRFLCLMLGLPPGSLDNSFASEAALAIDTPMGRLERIHTMIASRILHRNDAELSMFDYEASQDIDAELQKAAESLPGKWWLAPNLAGVDDRDVFQETLRMINQLYHYNLLNQIYLPFMLQFSAQADSEARRRYDYSKLTCVNATREVLSRFNLFRSFNRIAFCCRSVDFFALMAAMTLLLAHLDSHRHQHTSNFASSLLAHQRLSDRAMMEQVLDNMEHVSRLNMDILSKKSADLLRQLLVVEAAAAAGTPYSAERLIAPESNTMQPDEGQILRLNIPYFGLIKITCGGVISKEQPKSQQHASTKDQQNVTRPSEAQSSRARGGTVTSSFSGTNAMPPIRTECSYSQPLPPPTHQFGSLQTASHLEGHLTVQGNGHCIPQPTDSEDGVQQQPWLYPSLTAGTDDWTFQGVDLAFFENLLRANGMDNISEGSGTWPI